MYIDKKILAIVLLTASATWMIAASFLGAPAQADNVIRDSDYQMVTGHIVSGGDGLYVVDNRSGYAVVFTYDPNVRGIRPRSIFPLMNAFK